MLELPTLGPVATILLIVAISGVASWAATQLLRYAILWHSKEHHSTGWYNIVLRVISLLAGAAQGYILLSGALGLSIGAAAGALNTTIVAVVKSKLRTLKTSDATEQNDASDQTDPPMGV